MSKMALSQKEVIFRIDNEEYGISVSEVVSIEKAHELTAVRNVNPYLLGMINLRGSVIPIIDLGKVFRTTPLEVTMSTRYIIVSFDKQEIGFAVDSATDIIDVPSSIIQKPTLFSADFIYGIAKLEQRMIVLLDIPCLMKNVVGEITS